MKKDYNSVFKKLNVLIMFALLSLSINAQVGIGTTTPNSTVDVVTTATTGNSLELNHDNTSNGSSAAWFKNNGTGYGLHVQNLSATSNIPALRALQMGTGATAHGILISMNGTTSATSTGLFVSNYGQGSGIFTSTTNAGNAIITNPTGAGWGIYNIIDGTGSGIYTDISTNGGVGEYIDLGVNSGTGVYVLAVDNAASPTSGGDVFGFIGDIRTATPTGAGTVYGALFAGSQSGVGHGVLVNHSGASGRNAEFNINNATNTDAAIFALHSGQGSTVLAQNQNNVIAGTVNVGDFAYTGTDVADHIGVIGYSIPVAGWGIGSLGQGGWYGQFSLGNTGATGVKAFTIDHPEDPANKILKHFSIESNEVLNMYRGTANFDANGRAIVSLPNYYDRINKNPAYQLTPIGAAMPNLYVETEISNGQFVIAGGEPNKKVSWQITAERNDPYLQQNPNERNVIVNKEGERSGKYLMPELYNQPKEKGMFYNKNRKNQTVSKMNNSSIDLPESKESIKVSQGINEEGLKDKE